MATRSCRKTGQEVAPLVEHKDALLYGAGDEKLGRGDANEGRRIRKALMVRFPALEQLTRAVKSQAKKNSYLKLIDGRRAYVRSPHAALNTLLQGTGSIACKWWIAEFSEHLEREFGPQGWNGQWAALGWIHDEVQIAVRREAAERAAELVVHSLPVAGEKLGFRLPLEADYDIGASWADTH